MFTARASMQRHTCSFLTKQILYTVFHNTFRDRTQPFCSYRNDRDLFMNPCIVIQL